MIQSKRILFVLLITIFFLSACSSLNKVRHETRYYNLEYSSPRLSDLKSLPLVIKMEHFNTAPIYHTSRILYRDRSFDLKSYPYHKWRANPGDLVQYFLLRDLRASGLFKAILPYSSTLVASNVIEGSLDEFLEWDGTKDWQAVLSLSITLIKRGERNDQKRIVMQKVYRTMEPCGRKNPLAVVEAMSRAMSRTSEQIIRDLYTSLKEDH
jgi:ABC-type uncharacterized transport system auxiliary subunit